MKKIEHILGISIMFFFVIFLSIMIFGNDIEFLNKGRVSTSEGIGAGVFYSLADMIAYTLFIICCVLSIQYLLYIIGSRSKK